MSEETVEKELETPSPPKPEKSNLRRRSSVGRSFRRSQSTRGGLSFEDQLLIIKSNSDFEDRIEKVVNLALTTTCRAMISENDRTVGFDRKSDDDDSLKAALIDKLASGMGQVRLLESRDVEGLNSVLKMLKGSKNDGIQKPMKIVSSRVKSLQDYVSELKRERDLWQDLLQNRKNSYNLARQERQLVVKGDKAITSAERSKLSDCEDAWLRSLSDGSGELQRLKKQAVDLAIAENKFSENLNRKRKHLDDLTQELHDMSKKIELKSQKLILGSSNEEPFIKELPETEFGAEVKAWIKETTAK